MNCFYHPQVNAVGQCSNCQKGENSMVHTSFWRRQAVCGILLSWMLLGILFVSSTVGPHVFALSKTSASAASTPPISLKAVDVRNASNQSTNHFHHADKINFLFDLYNSSNFPFYTTVSGQVFSSSYYLLNAMNNSILVSGKGDHWYEWSLSIPSSAPSGIYYYKVVNHFGSGYPDQTLWATFQIDQFPAAGVYNGAGVFYTDNSGLQLSWATSDVYAYSSVPTTWRVDIYYKNVGTQNIYLTCAGVTDPAQVSEVMAGTGNSGTVHALQTFCSTNPSWTMTLVPGALFSSNATFYNVPLAGPGSTVYIIWYGFGRTLAIDPWHTRVS